jgi:hypothetical protein
MELTACRSRLERALQKPKDRRRDGRPVAPDLAFERVARPEVTSTRYHEPAYIDADLVEGVLERLRLGGRIDHVVGCAMNEQEPGAVAIGRRIAHRRRVEINAPVMHRRRAEIFLGHLVMRARDLAPRTAASQLGPAFNFGGLLAYAGLICDPSDRATNVIPTAKAIMVILICSSQRHNPDRQLWRQSWPYRRV